MSWVKDRYVKQDSKNVFAVNSARTVWRDTALSVVIQTDESNIKLKLF